MSAPANDGRPVQHALLHWLACWLSPLAVLLVAPRAELAATVGCFMLLLLPGALATPLLFSTAHPLGRFPGGLGLSAALGLALLGIVTLPATLWHWTFSWYLAVTGFVWLLTSLGLALWLARRGPRGPECDTMEPLQTADMRPRTACAALLAGALVLVAACRDTLHDSSWSIWFVVALAAGVTAAGLYVLDRRSTAASASVSSTTATTREDPERGFGPGLWAAVVCTVLFLTLIAHENRVVSADNVTYVSRATDFLAGGPMDLYEPSLGMRIPMDRGFVIATTSGLTAIVSAITGVGPAAQHNSLLPPLFVLVAAASMIALLSVLLSRHRLLLPLAALALFTVLATTMDGHESVASHMLTRLLQPKSIHLVAILPLQLATLALVFARPHARHTAVAGAMALAGHLVHPWSTIVAAVWTGCFALYAAVFRRPALGALCCVLGVTAGLGALQLWLTNSAPVGPWPTPATPPWANDLVKGASRLDLDLTLGRYSLFRLGVLSVPWLVVLGFSQKAVRPLVIVSLVALALAFGEAFADLMALVVPRSLLWRTRWMIPSAVHAALLAVVSYWAATAVLRATPLAARQIAAASLCAVLVGLAIFARASPGVPLRLAGPVAILSKFDRETYDVAEALGGWQGEPYVLVPLQERKPEPALAIELPQIMPRVRLIVSRLLVIEWFLGIEESNRRRQLVTHFYHGGMSKLAFQKMRQEFLVDRVVLDHHHKRNELQGQRTLLVALGWKHGYRGERYEIWRPGSSSGENLRVGQPASHPTLQEGSP